jgi:hypothetical protein
MVMVWTKVMAKEPIMQFVAADWLKSGKREDHLASRTSNLVQRFVANQRMNGKLEDPFFFIVNLQVSLATVFLDRRNQDICLPCGKK